MRNQAQIQIETLIILVILLLSAGILGVASANIIKAGDTASRIKACATSILAAETTKRVPITEGGAGGKPQSSISCERGKLLIKYEDIVESGKINQKSLNLKIANSLAHAWEAATEGRHDPFSEWESDEKAEYKTMCLIWDKIEFDRKLRNYLEKEKRELSFSFASLYETDMPNKDMKFSEYLYGQEEMPEIVTLPTVKIDEGTVIVAKEYKGALQAAVKPWMVLALTTSFFSPTEDNLIKTGYNFVTGEKCEECFYLWAPGIVPSKVSFSDFDEEVNGRKYRICDQIKN